MLLRKNVAEISIQKLTTIVVIVFVVDSKQQALIFFRFFFLKKAEMAEKSAFWLHTQILGDAEKQRYLLILQFSI